LVFENKLKIKESMVLVISKNLKELPQRTASKNCLARESPLVLRDII
jgi:hypothetical protein